MTISYFLSVFAIQNARRKQDPSSVQNAASDFYFAEYKKINKRIERFLWKSEIKIYSYLNETSFRSLPFRYLQKQAKLIILFRKT